MDEGGIILNIKVKCCGVCGIMAKVEDCSLQLNKFEFQWCYYIHLEINNLGKGINHFIPPPTAVF